ncbi:hypothetical protein P154DRAFT_39833 [Amniculicola lignicola CBS 123094]|uniref:Uncharacterized protein n=1 Tax=Amniculicola lignicola CBS 123094 TaxID=1392246 RepID=A0A6A5VZN5_9PLEO|nr:hypothetical protein P154DRAFT_39833 [Amniculicola lignicola CBS 123094]
MCRFITMQTRSRSRDGGFGRAECPRRLQSEVRPPNPVRTATSSFMPHFVLRWGENFARRPYHKQWGSLRSPCRVMRKAESQGRFDCAPSGFYAKVHDNTTSSTGLCDTCPMIYCDKTDCLSRSRPCSATLTTGRFRHTTPMSNPSSRMPPALHPWGVRSL